MTKIKAASIHFLFSLFFVSTFLIWVYFIWYDEIFAEISGVIQPIKMLVLVDVVLGPILTYIIYKKGKKSLKFDLSFVIIVQVAAFLYGAYTLYMGKPSLVVIKGGLFEVIIQKQVERSQFPEKFDSQFNSFSIPVYSRINQSKENLFTSTMTQQNNLELIDFSSDDIKKSSFNYLHILNTLEMSESELIEILESDNLDSNFYFPLIDSKKYGVLVVNKNLHPFKILMTDERILNVTTP